MPPESLMVERESLVAVAERRKREITEPSASALGKNQIDIEPRSGGTVFRDTKPIYAKNCVAPPGLRQSSYSCAPLTGLGAVMPRPSALVSQRC